MKLLGKSKMTTGSAAGLVVLATLMLMVHLPLARACVICLPMPRTTVADRLIDGDVVAFAREDPDRPFSYQAVEVLKGTLDSTAIDLFVNSSTRRRLALNPSHVVVLARDRKDKSWRTVGIADGTYQHVVRRILAAAQDWTGPSGKERRCMFFLNLFGHKDRGLFELAYLELGRAPYRIIKRVAPYVSRKDLIRVLQRREYLEWRSLAILMLAQSGNAEDRNYIEERFADSCKFSLTTNLAALATAYIELCGASAIKRIQKEYFENQRRTEEEVLAIITALSLHGQEGHTHLREQIVQSYKLVTSKYPKVTQSIEKDLSQWQTDKTR